MALGSWRVPLPVGREHVMGSFGLLFEWSGYALSYVGYALSYVGYALSYVLCGVWHAKNG